MNSRQRVVETLNFRASDRIAKDMGSHRSSGISCFAYKNLVKALGLPERRPKVFDIGQMLALVETDVLDALGGDVVLLDMVKGQPFITNAIIDEDMWEPYDFNGRLEAMIPKAYYSFKGQPDGSVVEENSNQLMPINSFVFDLPHGGQPVLDMDNIPLLDLDRFKEEFVANSLLEDSDISAMTALAKKVRSSTERAVHLSRSSFTSLIWPGGHAGMGIFPMICMMNPDYVQRYHEIQTEVFVKNMEMLLPAIADYVDIIDLGSGDWGTQQSTIMSPQMYKELFVPYYRQLHDKARTIAPKLKRLAHSCGAIYGILDIMIDDIGIQVINPVQWNAGNVGYKDWKEKLRGRMSMWGGALNSQQTLPYGTVDEVVSEVKQVVSYLADGGGYVFNNTHNILAEIDPEKVIAMYRAADEI